MFGQKKRLFTFPYAEQSDSDSENEDINNLNTKVIRHNPLRCKMLDASKQDAKQSAISDYRRCCRPSHLCWGTLKDKINDNQLRINIENDDEYKILVREWQKTVDEIAKKELSTAKKTKQKKSNNLVGVSNAEKAKITLKQKE
ncbi:unnamed protein product [Rotaria sp. Silwood1]|nr:unnamed protein product [Rotaria sp. Silwood1]CAF1553953.1 unnamed protein product [Rotaria sp. Silwood1]CAF3679635.1 unnamed protein product [Rotaria sp. Silwood1]CAF4874911.1 unnamed protein product [Rotaria sp. Silwood1]